MLLPFKYSLSFLFLVLVYGRRKDKQGVKQKRDINDLKDDPILTSIFKSDIQEKRNDRSVSPKDEKQDEKDERLKKEILDKVLSSAKDFHRRDTDNARFTRDINSSLQVPSSVFASFNENPVIGNAIPLAGASKLLNFETKPSENAAVIPELFQANFLPLENMEIPNPGFQGETVESVMGGQKAMEFKKSVIPDVPYLGGQKAMEFKKSVIPDVPYLVDMPGVNPAMNPGLFSQVIKKDEVNEEELPGSEGALDEPLLKPDGDGVKISDSMAVTSIPSSEPLLGQTNPEIKSTVEAPQVQNLDGAFTRPMISENGECSDQYSACNDFAKNEYCTKYPDLMKIQCRKSCGFCGLSNDSQVESAPVSNTTKEEEHTEDDKNVPGQKDIIEKEPKSKSSVADPNKPLENTTESLASNVTTKPTETATNETGGGRRSSTTTTEGSEADTAKTATTEYTIAQYLNKQEPPSKKSDETSKKSLEVLAKNSTDTESGSTTEVDTADAESGDAASGDVISGSGSGSGEEEPTVIGAVVPENDKKSALTATATRASVTKAKQEKPKEEKEEEVKVKKSVKHDSSNKIMGTVKAAKSNLGEFTLPVIQSQVSTASLGLNDGTESELDSGSGSGSGEDTEEEEEKAPAKKEKVHKAKPKTKPPAKKTKESKHVKAKTSDKSKSDHKAAKKSKKPEKATKKSKIPKTKEEEVTKKSTVPHEPRKTVPYPKIDLRLIASALAHYEEAALELAGEYPKQPVNKPAAEAVRSSIPKPIARSQPQPKPHPHPQSQPQIRARPSPPIETTERSIIPHPPANILASPPLFALAEPASFSLPQVKKEEIIDPLDKYRQNLQIAKLLTDDRNGRSSIPKYLKLSKDVHTGSKEEDDEKSHADSLTSIQKRFNILGVEPTLIDYYAETGKINPFASKHKKGSNVKKSSITNGDPYEYLRNMPAGASMLPIDDPKSRSRIPSDHSYPVFLMKVSPGEKKYIDEMPMRRGQVRHLNAEGVEIDSKSEGVGLPRDVVKELKDKDKEPALKRTQLPAGSSPPSVSSSPPNPFGPSGFSMLQNPFYPNTAQAMEMMSAVENLQKNLLQAQGNIPLARTAVPKAPVKKPVTKVNVPKPPNAKKSATAELTDAVAKAMTKNAISVGLQYAQNQMKKDQNNKLARARTPVNKFIQAQRGALEARALAVQRNRLAAALRQPKSIIKQAPNIRGLMSPYLNPALAMAPPVNDMNALKNKMVSAFFPMKKDGLEGSGEAGRV